MIAPAWIDYLTAHGAGHSPHGRRRTLLDHLIGTHRLLTKWRAGEEVRSAGLFHSVYGTSIYRRRSVPLGERERVACLIGPEAERLAYLFCIADRPRVWRAGSAPGRLATVTGRSIAIRPRQFGALLEIECANLIDQPGGAEHLHLPAARVERNAELVSRGCHRAVRGELERLSARPKSGLAGAGA